ncbi:MAG TPA: methylamine utilization protein MauJ [Acidobacteriaceae bacterium]|nr:methylamine utilization protein MauJ [Acidobacteriaceae bacterium]
MTDSNPRSTASQPAIQRRPRATGFPGENQGVIAVLHYIDTGSKAHLNAHGPAGLPGMYTVEFVLAKPETRNTPENEVRFADQRRGDSHLAITKPAVAIDIDPTEILLQFQSPSSPSLVFHGFPNDAGYLAKLKSEPFYALNRGEAEKIASTAARSLLSNLSAQLDIPLIIELVEVIELATGTKGITFSAPFPVTTLAVNARENPNDRELRHTMALYREALNSNTPIYRFLCFYKIIETSINRWSRLDPQQKISLGPQRRGERIPSGASKVEMEEWLAALFHVNRNWDEGILAEIFIPEVRGKKITNIFENQLREIRHKVAHGSLDSGDFLLLDESEDRELVVKWLPFLRCAARRRMKNDFDTFLRYLGEDGIVVSDPDE